MATGLQNNPQKGNHVNCITGTPVRPETMTTVLRNQSQTGNHDDCVSGTSLRLETITTNRQAVITRGIHGKLIKGDAYNLQKKLYYSNTAEDLFVRYINISSLDDRAGKL